MWPIREKSPPGRRSPGSLVLTGLCLALVSLILGWQAAPFATGPAGASLELGSTAPAAPNCRYGVAAWPYQTAWLADLGAGWFLDFNVDGHSTAAAEHFPAINIRQDRDAQGQRVDSFTVTPRLHDEAGGLGWWLAQRPGAIWILGNEPDRGPDPGGADPMQGDTLPQMYAQAYHDIYHFIKARDAQALVAIAGLVEVTPGRLQYLDSVWDTYRALYGTSMPVDVWNMHLYILPEVTPTGQPNGIANVALGTDPALGKRESGGLASQCHLDGVYCYAEHDDLSIFAEQVRAMRRWMRDHGQRDKPLILSEYSQLYPYVYDAGSGTWFLTDEDGNTFNPGRVSAFMEASFAYLEGAIDPTLGLPADGDRLVQRWLWYGVEVRGAGESSNLVKNGTLTQMGQTYQNWLAAQTSSLNLRPDRPGPVVTPLPAGQALVTPTLTATIRNNGTLRAGEPFTVTFYADSTLGQPIGSVEVPGPGPGFYGLTGCATRSVSVQVSWPGLGPGWHDYWIALDPGANQERPGGESDNVVQGQVLVPAKQAYFPLVPK